MAQRLNLSTIAKVISLNNPEAYSQAVKICEPMLSTTSIIPEIYTRIVETYPEMDRTDQSIMFTACVYSAYSPASLLGIQRAPNGIRKIMCEVMQWNDAPICNYYVNIAQAYCKNPKFKERMATILMGFEQFSIKGKN